MDYENLGFVEAIEELAQRAGLEVPQEKTRAPTQGAKDLYAIMAKAAEFYRTQLDRHPTGADARTYLRNRGLTRETMDAYGIGLAPPGWNNLEQALTTEGISPKDLVRAGLATQRDDGGRYDRFRHRIIFPIRDRRGRTVALGGRVFAGGEPKYLNSPETAIFQKGRELYGYFEARSRERKLDRMLVVEGYMDVVVLAQSGIGNAVATLGTATTSEHVKTLFRTVANVTFCFDGDRAGRDAAWRALQNTLPSVRDGREARFLFLPEGEDPDSLVRRDGAQAFSTRTSRATLLSEFLTEKLTSNLDTGKPDGQAAVLDRARPLLSTVPGGAFWELMVGRLSDLTHLAPERIKQLLSEKAAPAAKRSEQVAIKRTPVRHAVALLLYRPGLACNIENPEALRSVDEPGVTLLRELLEMGRQNPHLTTAGVVERYRGTQHETALTRLSTWVPEIPDDYLASELEDTVGNLLQRHGVAQRLLDKIARGEALTAAERESLRQERNRSDDEQNAH